MQVHLLRSEELSLQTYRDVLNVLNLFNGPITFVPSVNVSNLNQEDLEFDEVIYKDEDDFNKMLHVKFQPEYSSRSTSRIIPERARVLSWSALFSICKAYRKQQNINESAFVILLTDVPNDKNWFGGISDNGRDLFIHTGYWDYYFDGLDDFRYPIAYEVISWVLRSLTYGTPKQMIDHLHSATLGCYMDYCKDKRDVLMKMRTADICTSCMNDIAKRELSSALVSQSIETMEGIRRSMTFRDRFNIINLPSKLEIRGPMKRIHLPDLGGAIVPLNPKERAVYLVFLSRPNGIRLSELSDFTSEIRAYYERFSNESEQARIDAAIERLVNPLENNLSEVLSRIRRKFRSSVGIKMADFYIIGGASGEAKRIVLDRSLVIGDLMLND